MSCQSRLWFLLPAVSSEGILNVGSVLPSDGQTGYVARIGDDAPETRVSQRIACVPSLLGDVFHVKAGELKRTGVLQGLSK
jgi:hypothetical protein